MSDLGMVLVRSFNKRGLSVVYNGRRVGLAFVPYSLRRVEQAILDELGQAGFSVIFSINNFDVRAKRVDYVLVGVGRTDEVPEKARRIVQKHLDRWKATYIPQ